MLKLPMDIIKIEKQIRESFDHSAIVKLAINILLVSFGQPIHPIVVAPLNNQTHVLIAGETRYRAKCLIRRWAIDGKYANFFAYIEQDDISTISAVIHHGDRLMVQLSENFHRNDLKLIEEARAVARYMVLNPNATQGEVGQLLQMSQSRVSKLLSLANAPNEIQVAAESDKISLSDVESAGSDGNWNAILHRIEKTKEKTKKNKSDYISFRINDLLSILHYVANETGYENYSPNFSRKEIRKMVVDICKRLESNHTGGLLS